MTNPKHTDTSRGGDLVARLRKHVFYGDARLFNFKKHSPLAMEAADRIEALEAENERLREAVGEIKEAWDWWNVDTYDRRASVVDDAIRAALGDSK